MRSVLRISLFSLLGAALAVGALALTPLAPLGADAQAQGSRSDIGWIGVALQELDSDLREGLGLERRVRGALVTEVVDDGPADAAGLQPHDVIVEIDNVRVSSVDEAVKAARASKPGNEITVIVNRGGKERGLAVTLGSLADAGDSRFGRRGGSWAPPVAGGHHGKMHFFSDDEDEDGESKVFVFRGDDEDEDGSSWTVRRGDDDDDNVWFGGDDDDDNVWFGGDDEDGEHKVFVFRGDDDDEDGEHEVHVEVLTDDDEDGERQIRVEILRDGDDEPEVIVLSPENLKNRIHKRLQIHKGDRDHERKIKKHQKKIEKKLKWVEKKAHKNQMRIERDVHRDRKHAEREAHRRFAAPRMAIERLAGGFLGVETTGLSDQLADYFGVSEDEGVLVTKVVEDSPAEKAGLKAGDVIVALGDKGIENGNDLRRAVRDHEPGEEIRIRIVRKGSRKTLEATLGDVSDFGSNLMFAPEAPALAGIELPEFDLHEMHGALADIELPEIDLSELHEMLSGIELPEFDLPELEKLQWLGEIDFDDLDEEDLKELEALLHQKLDGLGEKLHEAHQQLLELREEREESNRDHD